MLNQERLLAARVRKKANLNAAKIAGFKKTAMLD
jgi:hypothetical protein